LYVPVTTPVVVSFLMQVVALVHPQWQWVGRHRRLIASALTVVAILLLLGAGDLVVPTGAVPVEPRAIALLNRGVVMMLSLALAGVLVQIAVEAWRLVRRRSSAARAMTA
jgi:hypothetical protein